MQTYKIVSALVVLLLISVFPFTANAMTPTLSVSATGTGDNVQINVIGDPNVSILFFYSGSQFITLGSTSSSGNFSTVISSSTYSIAANALVYVKTGGLSGTQSTSVSWPYVQNTTTSNNITLSQGALLLNMGQTSTVTASSSYLYVLSNSNPSIANINLNANQITITANTYGSTVANICVVGSTTNCSTITVTVQSSGAQQLNFSQNNFSIVSGQSAQITVTGGSGTYLISNNSNSSSISSSLSGATVTLSASGTTGSASITVCTTDMNNCGIINISSTTANSTAVTFSQTNPVVPIGQSTTVTIYGGSGANFYVSSNSNPSIVQANINSNILTLIGNATGTSTINICAYAGTCASLTANVSSVTNNGGPILLSQSTVSILAGQSANITISGGSTPYSISSNSPNIFNGVINGNILTVYGVNSGSGTASICSSAGCATLSITINNSNSSVNPPTFSQNNVLLNVGQQSTIYISGNSGYYVSNNSTPTVASVLINGNAATVTASNTGTANISMCQNGGQCATLYVTVSNANTQIALSQNNVSLTAGQSTTIAITGSGVYYVSNNLVPTVASAVISGSSVVISAINAGTTNISVCQGASQCATLYVAVTGVVTPTASAYAFLRYLGPGDKGDDVLKLQQVLSNLGFLTATPNGYYGLATKAAVQKFQKAHGIKQSGNVGPSTKDTLNQLSASSTASTTSSTTQTASAQQIQQAIAQLMAQVAQMQGR
ncbi:MAG: peptidoglycan-binding domain-containing protein [Candidatus Staskawiczbacteria bacterium]|nr:peptidoglycan-binding domain-containing protein [Candidatus Staskawiczbacteria bacterium]